MDKLHRVSWITLLAALSIVTPAHAGGYTEGVDLSNDRLNPTPVPIDTGSNIIQGTMGYTGTVLDRDYFTITLPPDTELRKLVLGDATQVGGCCSFIGVQAGPIITVDPDTTSGAALLGWTLYATADKGNDLLPAMGFPVDKIGFTGPLPAGTYTFWVQELAPSNGPYPFQFDFQVAAVPEPSTYALLGLGLGMVGFALNRPMRKRRLG